MKFDRPMPSQDRFLLHKIRSSVMDEAEIAEAEIHDEEAVVVWFRPYTSLLDMWNVLQSNGVNIADFRPATWNGEVVAEIVGELLERIFAGRHHVEHAHESETSDYTMTGYVLSRSADDEKDFRNITEVMEQIPNLDRDIKPSIKYPESLAWSFQFSSKDVELVLPLLKMIAESLEAERRVPKESKRSDKTNRDKEANLLKTADKATSRTTMPPRKALTSDSGRSKTPARRRLDLASVVSPPARASMASQIGALQQRSPVDAGVDKITTALVQLDIAAENKGAILAAVKEDIAAKSEETLIMGPRRLAQMPLGTGSGAAVAAQVSSTSVYKAAQLTEPLYQTPLAVYTDALDAIKEEAARSGLRPITADDDPWAQFTPAMKPRPAGFGDASALGGRLKVVTTDRESGENSVTSGVELWRYCHDHDVNQAAEAMFAYDATMVPGDVLDPYITLAAQLVVARGLMTQRSVTPENATLISAALSTTNTSWVQLDDSVMLAEPGIRFLAVLPQTAIQVDGPEEARLFANSFHKAVMACRGVVETDKNIDVLLESQKTLELNEARARQLQWVATLYRALDSPHWSPPFRLRVGYAWRAKIDSLTKSMLEQASQSGQVERWIARLRALTEDDLRQPQPVIKAFGELHSDDTTTEMRLLLASVLVDSHYLNFSESKRQAWRDMLQASGEPLPMVRAYYFMNAHV